MANDARRLRQSNEFNDRTLLDTGGHPHTEDLRITARFQRWDFGHGDASISMIIRGRMQFETKIAQFPKGTVFDLGTNIPDNAYRKARLDGARKIVEDAGMKVNTDEHRSNVAHGAER